ncbi:hypothetical protein MICRO8M_60306 [Microbacterium sp. 8M]|nr:hypothetical protein MICRO8M_60306 [Microbacterium sp. 8M]
MRVITHRSRIWGYWGHVSEQQERRGAPQGRVRGGRDVARGRGNPDHGAGGVCGRRHLYADGGVRRAGARHAGRPGDAGHARRHPPRTAAALRVDGRPRRTRGRRRPAERQLAGEHRALQGRGSARRSVPGRHTGQQRLVLLDDGRGRRHSGRAWDARDPGRVQDRAPRRRDLPGHRRDSADRGHPARAGRGADAHGAHDGADRR